MLRQVVLQSIPTCGGRNCPLNALHIGHIAHYLDESGNQIAKVTPPVLCCCQGVFFGRFVAIGQGDIADL